MATDQIPVLSAAQHADWKVERRQTKSGFSSYEVFTDPQGVEWIRAGSDEATELIIEMKLPLPPLRLKRLSRPFGGKIALSTAPVSAQATAAVEEA